MSILIEAMAEVEAAEAEVLPRFECGVYTKRIILDELPVAGPVSEHSAPPMQALKYRYEDIEPEPWWRFVEPT